MVEPSKNSDLRKNEIDWHKTKSSRKCHIVSVNKSRRSFSSLYFRDSNASKMIFLGESMNHVQDIDIPEKIADDKIETNQDTLFELGPYISLRLASNEIEPFYLAEVNDQGITNEKKNKILLATTF